MGYINYNLEQIVKHLCHNKNMFHKILNGSPDGTLQIRKYKGNDQYVYAVPHPNKPRSYIRRGITRDDNMIASLVGGQYARTALKIIEHNESLLKRYNDEMIDLVPEEIIKRMPPQYRNLGRDRLTINPGFDPCHSFSSEGFVPSESQIRWAEEDYERSDYHPEDRNKETSRGLLVRSKSEVLLSESFYGYGFPFRYEQVLTAGKYRLAPDFTLLDRNNNEFYVEYCGMMNDPDYVDHFVWKRKLYESIGICEWRDMVFVFEENNLINMQKVDNIIKTFILPRM